MKPLLLLGLLKPSAAVENETRKPASVDCDVPRRETQGELLQEQVKESTNVDSTVEGIGLLWGAGSARDEVPPVLIREGGSIVPSPVEILKIVEDVVEVNLARGVHGVVESNGLGWDVGGDEDPVNLVHIDWEEQIAQSEDVDGPGPLAHGIEAVSVGRGLVGEGGVCPNSKQFGVKLGSETIAAFAVAHGIPVEVQVAVDQQGSAGMDGLHRPATVLAGSGGGCPSSPAVDKWPGIRCSLGYVEAGGRSDKAAATASSAAGLSAPSAEGGGGGGGEIEEW